MDAETAARFDALDVRLDRMMEGIARQFEAMQKRADERHERLLEALWGRFDGIDR